MLKMGVIAKQSIFSSAINYLGVLVGIVSALLIYPLNLDMYGYISYLYGSAQFLIHFASLGTISLVVKFFPQFKSKTKGHFGFLFFILLATIISWSIFAGVIYFNQTPFIGWMEKIKMGYADLDQNLKYIIILTGIVALISIFIQYISNFKKIVIPTFLNNFLFKLFLPLIVFLNFKSLLSDENSVISTIGFFLFVLLALIVYTKFIGELKLKPNLKIWNKSLRKEVGTYWLFGMLQSIGSKLAFRIDIIMVSMMLGFSLGGVYGIILVLANMIDIPNKSIAQISSPIISEAWKTGDTDNIKNIYTKSSIILITIGLFLFGGVWLNLDDVFSISTNTARLSEGKYVFLFLGLAKIVDLATSVNSHIIIFSKYYKVNLLFMLGLGFLNIYLNWHFIGLYGVTGAALATCISLVCFNVAKYLFILVKMKMQPFSSETMKIVLIFFIAFGASAWIPDIGHPLANIFIKSLVFSMIYISSVLFFKISEDIQQLVYTFVGRFKK